MLPDRRAKTCRRAAAIDRRPVRCQGRDSAAARRCPDFRLSAHRRIARRESAHCRCRSPASSCSHSWGAVICTPRSVANSNSIGGAPRSPQRVISSKQAQACSQVASRIQSSIALALTRTPRRTSWPVPSRCSPASGPICRWKTCAARRATSAIKGLELACWGDHFEVDKALADSNYCSAQARSAGPLRLAVPRDQLAPGRPGRVRSDRPAAQLDPAAARVGRRRPGRRQSPRRRGDEEHGPRRPAARRRRGQRLHRLEHLAPARIRFRPCPSR